MKEAEEWAKKYFASMIGISELIKDIQRETIIETAKYCSESCVTKVDEQTCINARNELLNQIK